MRNQEVKSVALKNRSKAGVCSVVSKQPCILIWVEPQLIPQQQGAVWRTPNLCLQSDSPEGKEQQQWRPGRLVSSGQPTSFTLHFPWFKRQHSSQLFPLVVSSYRISDSALTDLMVAPFPCLYLDVIVVLTDSFTWLDQTRRCAHPPGCICHLWHPSACWGTSLGFCIDEDSAWWSPHVPPEIQTRAVSSGTNKCVKHQSSRKLWQKCPKDSTQDICSSFWPTLIIPLHFRQRFRGRAALERLQFLEQSYTEQIKSSQFKVKQPELSGSPDLHTKKHASARLNHSW